MFKKTGALALALFLIVGLAGGVVAQDPTSTPDAEVTEQPTEEAGDMAEEVTPEATEEGETGPGTIVTLEELTGVDEDEFYGETVTLEGVVMDVVNVYSFILGEDVALDDDQVLVINTSGELLPADLVPDAQATVTGVVANHVSEGGYDEVVANLELDEEFVTNADGETLWRRYVLDAYPDFTVIELVSVVNVTVRPAETETEEAE
jgi:hypothetical protein